MIEYIIDSDGGFTCGDTVTGFTVYAYPTSTTALQARRDAAGTARRVLSNSEAFHARHASERHIVDYDARNWARLGYAGLGQWAGR